MVQCPLCFNQVKAFKPNCHVIPRWQVKQTKTNGRYFEISHKKVGTSQSDLKTQSWCEACEEDFAKLDAVGAAFFRSLEAKKNNVEDADYHLYEFKEPENYYWVNKFLCSIIVRFYLHYSQKKLRSDFEHLYNNLYQAYINDTETFAYFFDITKFCLTTVSTPAVCENGIQVMLNGYLTIINTDFGENNFVAENAGKFIVFKVTDPNAPYVKYFFEKLRPHTKPDRRPASH